VSVRERDSTAFDLHIAAGPTVGIGFEGASGMSVGERVCCVFDLHIDPDFIVGCRVEGAGAHAGSARLRYSALHREPVIGTL